MTDQTDQTNQTFDLDDMTTAMCLWEAMLGLQATTAPEDDDMGDDLGDDGDEDADADADGDEDADGDDDGNDDDDGDDDDDGADRDADVGDRAREMIEDHGSNTIRGALVDLVRPCRDKWKERIGDGDTDEQFDWDWCPMFLREAIADGTLEAAIERQYGS